MSDTSPSRVFAARGYLSGPVGLEGLTSLKYIVLGDGQIRS